MGLDNGIIVCSKIRELKREDLPKGLIYPFEEDWSGAPEIAYWRKCWGLRNEIVEFLTRGGEESPSYKLTRPKHVLAILIILETFKDKKVWEEKGSSIWNYKTAKVFLKEQIHNLKLIYKFMQLNPDVYLEFYDSY